MDNIFPFHAINQQVYYLLQGTELSIENHSELQYIASTPIQQLHTDGSFVLCPGEWLGSGTFRNSLYLEPFRNFTNIKNIQLCVDIEGSAKIVIFQAGPSNGATELARYRIDSLGTRTKKILPIGLIHFLSNNSRVFWHIEGIDNGCVVHNSSYVVNTKPKQPDLRMAVLLRTYGRTEDLKAILANFVEQSRQIPYYKYLLSRFDFWVLDTSGNIARDYAEEWQNDLNLRVYEGPNLGGGGNASIIQKLFFDHAKGNGEEPQEVLILDDDLQVSLETLVRHFNFCLFRSKPVLSSLPVLKKSEPNLVWEDGAYWGRKHPHHHVATKRRSIEPTLLKHMQRLSDPSKADIFCNLNTCEYSTFIFLGIPTVLLRSLGFPAAFFLRGDDIELSLRAGKLGHTLFTNPNLAAWHEPGHSYAQEYMAILHGIIINMAYSENDAGDFIRFFEQRIAEHSSIDDLVGLAIYHAVLRDLLDVESSILTTNFQRHYLARLKEFGAHDWIKTTESVFGAYEHKLRTSGHPIVNFLYPGYNPNLRTQPNSIVLKQPSAYAFREIPPSDAKDKLEVIQEFMNDLKIFSDNYEVIRDRWIGRMKESSEEGFWETVQAERIREISLIFSNALSGDFHQILEKDYIEKSTEKLRSKNETFKTPKIFYSLFKNTHSVSNKLDLYLLLKYEKEDFVIASYRKILHREPDLAGLNTYMSQLSRGVSKLKILRSLANSNESKIINSNIKIKCKSRLKLSRFIENIFKCLIYIAFFILPFH